MLTFSQLTVSLAMHAPHPHQVLMEFPQLTMSLPDGREESIMKRTCLVRHRGEGLTTLECGRCAGCYLLLLP